MSWNELWAVQKLGSKVSASISPKGDEIALGITNMASRIGVSNGVSLEDARALAFAILEVTGGMPISEAIMASDPGMSSHQSIRGGLNG